MTMKGAPSCSHVVGHHPRHIHYNLGIPSNEEITIIDFVYICHLEIPKSIRVITKLPNSEQSYKGKVKTHNYINRQNQSTTGKL
jgi:hypothetical protein